MSSINHSLKDTHRGFALHLVKEASSRDGLIIQEGTQALANITPCRVLAVGRAGLHPTRPLCPQRHRYVEPFWLFPQRGLRPEVLYRSGF